MNDLKNLNCLLPRTKSVLEKLIKEAAFLKNYALVGGSALTLHICHRKSEDLDFFTYSDHFEKSDILNHVHSYTIKEIINETKEQIDFLLDGVKVTFFNSKGDFLRPNKIKSFNLANIDNISAMKINTLFLRAKYRDYYDIFSIMKEGMSLDALLKNAMKILPELNHRLFFTALLYTEDIEEDNIDHFDPKYNISKIEIRDFLKEKVLEFKESLKL
jgi:predicted nucleotidyltransferase component of viral defense system